MKSSVATNDIIELKAPAKVNLHLGVHAEFDERHYHRVDSVMASLDLCDLVTVRADRLTQGTIEVTCTPDVGIPPEKNTCYRAAANLASLVGAVCSVHIAVQKHIPDQAGLGGSSSDAAATLKALSRLWGIDETDPRLEEAARLTGADVPFFLDGAPAYLKGAGDVFEERFERPHSPIPVALVRPEGPGVSTPVAYAAFDEDHEEARDPGPLCDVLRSDQASGAVIASLLANNLEPVAMRLHPGIRELRPWLAEQEGVLGCQVTGSGSCLFAICEDDAAADRIVCQSRTKFKSWAESSYIV